MKPESRASSPSNAASMEAVRRQWGSAVAEDVSEGASIKSSAFLPDDAAGAPPASADSSPNPVSAPRRNVATGEGDDGPGDFVLGELLGKGGMGLVFRAGQAGLDREVALKTIIPDRSADAEARRKFFAEAQVTGQLDHPNIVPIYELATAPDGALFYTMKEVRGRPWSKALSSLSEAENIDILLKVADAVAFAHGKGVIHRDLKPENVMLGDYGEVLLMDWGLAVGITDGAKAERLSAANARGGTPAYMAPEMAAADPAKIGPASDVYLLGAILYEILTGARPHHGQNVFACIASALQNTIPPAERRDEWMGVARQALSTDPASRPAEVKVFQRSIRDCREHAASLALSKEARATLTSAKKSGDYTDHARAVFGFGEALRLWPENNIADMGLTLARKAYARTALARGDFDLALSQTVHMSAGDAGDIGQRAEAGKAERERRRIRVKRLTQLSAGLVGLVLLVGGFAYWRVSKAQGIAEAEATRATAALASETKALTSEQVARQMAEAARKEAVKAQEKSESALTAKEEAESKARTARTEQLRLSDELAGAAGKLGLWERTESSRASLLGVSLDDAAEAGESALSLAIKAVDAMGARSSELERKAKALASLSAMAQRVDDFSALVAAFERVEDEAAKADNVILRNNIHEYTTLIRRRLPPDHSRYPERTLAQLARDSSASAIDPDSRIKQDLHDALKAANPLYSPPHPNAHFTVENGQIVGADFYSANVPDISPLRGLPLRRLQAEHNAIKDLSPLIGMPLEELWLDGNKPESLEPLRNLPLKKLQVTQCGDVDLSPLRGKRFQYLDVWANALLRDGLLDDIHAEELHLSYGHGELDFGQLRRRGARSVKKLKIHAESVDLSKLKGLALSSLELHIHKTLVASLEPLRGMPLTELDCAGNAIQDLEPLRGMPLTKLFMENNPIQDFTPLVTLPLNTLTFDPDEDIPGFQALRAMDSLENIGLNNIYSPPPRDAKTFWSEYDLGGMAQYVKVKKALREKNPQMSFQQFFGDFREGKLIGLHLRYTRLNDISPLRGLPLERLEIGGNDGALSDFSPLAGMPLKRLHCWGNTHINDLTPLRGMPLEDLQIVGSGTATSLEPLRELPLKYLSMYGYKNSDLTPLAGKTLDALRLTEMGISDVTPLMDCVIGNLEISNNAIPDVTVLARAEGIKKISQCSPTDAAAMAAVQATQRPK